MVAFPLLFIYVLCCFGVGYLGRTTRAGFIGVTLISVLFSPLIVLLAVLLLRSTEEVYVRGDAGQPNNSQH
ncbi:hypothetical protein SAMN06265365_103374 [Tistlia consotensis]|uniref:Uncharacterized protein n=1 Tax=Tistlia consotensis USBA 355 TaxID=560819 RepID=A0A1Y6C9W2_9PROT|nr:hypothetical protein [Tistlia consotensis]SMF44558.1 hypothetical protein SAMN05428998_115136 [Tistlia consotensis USBA 355]SNR43346.1 hypothetical protein SAMN06265365_103374 [Tistlia consotensis]